MPHSTTPYYEQQLCPPWVIPIVAAGGLAGIVSLWSGNRSHIQDSLPGVAAMILVYAVISNLLVMRTRVDGDQLVITFGWAFALYTRRIRLTQIESAEAVTYNPILQYGGWGIRGFGNTRALNMRGNRGVQLVLKSGEHLLIGSSQPEELLAAIRTGS